MLNKKLLKLCDHKMLDIYLLTLNLLKGKLKGHSGFRRFKYLILNVFTVSVKSSFLEINVCINRYLLVDLLPAQQMIKPDI